MNKRGRKWRGEKPKRQGNDMHGFLILFHFVLFYVRLSTSKLSIKKAQTFSFPSAGRRIWQSGDWM
jgi:hypothetical protein